MLKNAKFNVFKVTIDIRDIDGSNSIYEDEHHIGYVYCRYEETAVRYVLNDILIKYKHLQDLSYSYTYKVELVLKDVIRGCY